LQIVDDKLLATLTRRIVSKELLLIFLFIEKVYRYAVPAYLPIAKAELLANCYF
jgi:hypothetical protein